MAVSIARAPAGRLDQFPSNPGEIGKVRFSHFGSPSSDWERRMTRQLAVVQVASSCHAPTDPSLVRAPLLDFRSLMQRGVGWSPFASLAHHLLPPALESRRTGSFSSCACRRSSSVVTIVLSARSSATTDWYFQFDSPVKRCCRDRAAAAIRCGGPIFEHPTYIPTLRWSASCDCVVAVDVLRHPYSIVEIARRLSGWSALPLLPCSVQSGCSI